MEYVVLPNFPQARIYPDGRIFNTRTDRWCAQNTGPAGRYLVTTLTDISGYKQARYVHRLVATAFIPNPAHKPQVNHRDHNRLNNAVPNLEWVTPSENKTHDYATGHQKPSEHWRTRTHCKYGHEYNDINTRYVGNHRTCRVCDRDRLTIRRKRHA